MTLKTEIDELMKLHKKVCNKTYSLDEIIAKKIYSDEKHKPEVLTCATSDDIFTIDIAYTNSANMDETKINKIIDSINDFLAKENIDIHLNRHDFVKNSQYYNVGNCNVSIELKYPCKEE